jgi:hypothetical protein
MMTTSVMSTQIVLSFMQILTLPNLRRRTVAGIGAVMRFSTTHVSNHASPASATATARFASTATGSFAAISAFAISHFVFWELYNAMRKK